MHNFLKIFSGLIHSFVGFSINLKTDYPYFPVSRGFITLCFSEGNAKQCYYTSQSPLGRFNEVDPSNFDHKLTRIASSTNEVMAIGSRLPDHAKVEFLNLNTFQWSQGPTYPYHNAINYAPVVFHEGGFLVFGGFTDSEQVKTIARDGNS